MSWRTRWFRRRTFGRDICLHTAGFPAGRALRTRVRNQAALDGAESRLRMTDPTD